MDKDFRVGNWVVRPQRLCIHHPGKTVHITPKSMAVLECLARAGGDVVSRNDLLDTVWPGAAVTDDVLTQCIVELRKAFDDSAQKPRFIETIPKRGFRLVAEVAPFEKGQRLRRLLTVVAAVIIVVAAVGYLAQDLWSPFPVVKSIAVLPFTDLSPDGDQEYFTDGLTDELIVRLTSLDGLQVTGRASSFHFKDSDEDMQTIGQQLSVSHVLDGSVRRAGNELRVTAKLTDVSSGIHLWSNTYERQIEDLFDVQEQIAEAVAAALSVGLSVGEIAGVDGGTINVKAYDEYLAGNAVIAGTGYVATRAIEHFERATDLDPTFALAWARLAGECHHAFLEWGDSKGDRFLQRRDAAIAKAVSIAPRSRDVLTTRARIALWDGNLREGRLLLDKVHELDDGGEIQYSFADVDLALKTGIVWETYKMLRSMRRQDPLNPLLPVFLSQTYLNAGRSDEWLSKLDEEYEKGGRKLDLAAAGIVASLATGRHEELRRWLMRGSAVVEGEYFGKNLFDVLMEHLDDQAAMLDLLESIYDNSTGKNHWIIYFASYYGADELVLKSMRRSHEAWAFWTPLTRRIRETEEFKEIVVEAGLVDYWREFGWGNFCSPTEGDDFECH